MNEMLNSLAEFMISKIRIVNRHNREWVTDESQSTEKRPRDRFDHELRGMEQALFAMDIPFEYEYGAELDEITAIIIIGNRYEI